uniref:Uncharacterized protein n=1 Tax=Chromera velia CCMP2878 TaxID=1169474 RepID=A0A0G4HYX0_9ALVE|eukprot:Cvel_9591.t1-p1 / transcript=Cvel_9591.t1 / gene=Cvel_9591 / organism=Chromera_velia_CCMP2878 / gene_product=hypothetical protein / transcript_product=hypothetical protein / location=Cvel_scaffold556:60656-62106(-) / protein_length=193 / sequence_SO=supercontig / SO=protein_coding / is_pseudo=false
MSDGASISSAALEMLPQLQQVAMESIDYNRSGPEETRAVEAALVASDFSINPQVDHDKASTAVTQASATLNLKIELPVQVSDTTHNVINKKFEKVLAKEGQGHALKDRIGVGSYKISAVHFKAEFDMDVIDTNPLHPRMSIKRKMDMRSDSLDEIQTIIKDIKKLKEASKADGDEENDADMASASASGSASSG